MDQSQLRYDKIPAPDRADSQHKEDMNGAQEAVPKEVEGNSETISEGKAGNISLTGGLL